MQPRNPRDAGPKDTGDHALDRLREFERQRGLPSRDVPDAAQPSAESTHATPEVAKSPKSAPTRKAKRHRDGKVGKGRSRGRPPDT
jgi:hypothetical protein